MPDEIVTLEPMTRAKDGKPAKIAFYRFRTLPPKDNANLGPFEFAIGDDTGTKWDNAPGTLRKFLEEQIHNGQRQLPLRSGSLIRALRGATPSSPEDQCGQRGQRGEGDARC